PQIKPRTKIQNQRSKKSVFDARKPSRASKSDTKSVIENKGQEKNEYKSAEEKTVIQEADPGSAPIRKSLLQKKELSDAQGRISAPALQSFGKKKDNKGSSLLGSLQKTGGDSSAITYGKQSSKTKSSLLNRISRQNKPD
ncbi:MAG: hypothetical protein GY786_03770, partial [Proteobacteria bacterium]|nr:hypothetical protein [Pseudomonadota bacterium]